MSEETPQLPAPPALCSCTVVSSRPDVCPRCGHRKHPASGCRFVVLLATPLPATPATKAGQRLLLRLTTRDTSDLTPFEAAILAIETEAADAERSDATARPVLDNCPNCGSDFHEMGIVAALAEAPARPPVLDVERPDPWICPVCGQQAVEFKHFHNFPADPDA